MNLTIVDLISTIVPYNRELRNHVHSESNTVEAMNLDSGEGRLSVTTSTV